MVNHKRRFGKCNLFYLDMQCICSKQVSKPRNGVSASSGVLKKLKECCRSTSKKEVLS